MGSLTVTVKEIEGGLFSSYANTHLKTGETLEVGRTKMGVFFMKLKRKIQIPLSLFAAGSGITPIMSIARNRLRNRDEQQICIDLWKQKP